MLRRFRTIARSGVLLATACGLTAASRVFAQAAPTRPLVSHAPQTPTVTRASARVIGDVFDSTAMQPLAGALVQLVSLDDPANIRSTTTRPGGTFVIDSVVTGMYLLGFLHDKLDSLDAESVLHRVHVPSAGDIEAHLVIPSAATIMTERCGAPPRGQAPTMFIGVVRSARGPMLSAPARVRAQWTEILVGPKGIERRNPARFTDATVQGFFTFCGVPTDAPILVRAFAGTDSSGVVELKAPANGLLVRDVFVGEAVRTARPVASEKAGSALPPVMGKREPRGTIFGAGAADGALTAPQVIAMGTRPVLPAVRGKGRLRGYVRTEAGKPVAGARIGVWDGTTDTTNADGQFSLAGLPTGSYTLESRALGFQVTRKAVDVFEHSDATVDVVMDALAPVLDAVKVKARADVSAVPLADFERRKKSGFGHFLDEAQITQRAAMTTADLFRTTPGMTIIAGVGSGDKVLMRNAGSGGSCVPAVFMNGVMVPTDGNLDAFIKPDEVRGVEIYARTASVPLEFQSRNGCGSIVLWTGARRTPAKP